ncbi:MAG: HIT domain-containing protein [Propionibacteriaceae bacterium]|jgi:ATP adenylyltransferase|nr:HIT domain-containing protein [Propionibacteriaceae bacterium]
MSETQPVIEAASAFAGVEDGFERLWTPHRMAYIDSHHDTGESTPVCPFCAAPARTDEDGLIVHRGDTAYVLLNLFPYNPGHVLVCPYRHVADYTELTLEETVEIAELTRKAMEVTRRALKPDGFNLGMNQGAVAGAGIAAHLHQHIVPRWGGDSNFFPIIAATKALPSLLSDTRNTLSGAWS